MFLLGTVYYVGGGAPLKEIIGTKEIGNYWKGWRMNERVAVSELHVAISCMILASSSVILGSAVGATLKRTSFLLWSPLF